MRPPLSPSKQKSFSILRMLFSALTISHIHSHAGERGSGTEEGGRALTDGRDTRCRKISPGRKEERKKSNSNGRMAETLKSRRRGRAWARPPPPPDKNLSETSLLPTRGGSIQRALYSVLFDSPVITHGVPVRMKRKTGCQLVLRNSRQNTAAAAGNILYPPSALPLPRPRT